MLHHDLHAEEGDVPAGVEDDVVEQPVQARHDLVRDAELLGEVAVVDLDVARLVGHLVGGVELRLGPRDALHDLRRGQERALLAVEELREHEGVQVELHPDDLVVAEVDGRAQHRVDHRRETVGDALPHESLDVDVGGPVEVVGVPGERLPFLVQVEQIPLAERVLPVEDAVDRRRDLLVRAAGRHRERIPLGVLHRYLLPLGALRLLRAMPT
ncbi:MAG: hypothetical protein E6J79_20510 [Deltaproteobacteria bacterium]|nr:MAG: hypothetical protein E6J79_20510 [Deltaproteobacteria bacterium]